MFRLCAFPALAARSNCWRAVALTLPSQLTTVWLLAENPEFAPIEVDLKEQELVIEGLSVGVIRR